MRSEQFKTLNEIHSNLVIAETFTTIRDQRGNECLRKAINDLYNFMRSEYKTEWESKKVDPFL